MAQLDADLAPEVRESIAYAFRELLLNAVEWGGKLDPKRKVRIACLRAQRMLLYRIADPGPGFNIEDLPHAAIGHGPDQPDRAHEGPRGEGHPPGRIRPADGARAAWTSCSTTRSGTRSCS